MDKDELERQSENMKKDLREIIGKGERAQWHVLANVCIARADVDASLALVEEVIQHLPVEMRPAFSIQEEFLRLRREKLENLLITLEEKNPELAAAIQEIVTDFTEE